MPQRRVLLAAAVVAAAAATVLWKRDESINGRTLPLADKLKVELLSSLEKVVTLV